MLLYYYLYSYNSNSIYYFYYYLLLFTGIIINKIKKIAKWTFFSMLPSYPMLKYIEFNNISVILDNGVVWKKFMRMRKKVFVQ